MIHLVNKNPNKLHNELIAAGVQCIVKNDKKEGEYLAANTWIELASEADLSLAQQIINAHDPTPLPPQPTEVDYLLDLDFRLSMIELGL